MNDTIQIPLTDSDLIRLARAMQFAFMAVILGLSYYVLRASLTIPVFQQQYIGMFNGKPLPSLTLFVLHARAGFFGISLLIPILAVGTLFFRRRTSSFYFFGLLALVIIVAFVLLCQGLSAPLFEVISLMQGGPRS